jgi:anti-sigma factor RsiW
MTCAESQPLLTAYHDRELDPASSARIAGHVATCAGCAATLERAAAVRSALVAGAPPHVLPAHLRQRVRAAVGDAARRRPVWSVRARRWAAVPLAAMLAAALAWSTTRDLTRPGAPGHVVDELVAGHVRALMADHLVDVASTDQHTVRPWFNGKIDFAPPVADFTADGFPLVGGRVDYLDGRAAAALVYRRRQHLVNVFVWPTDEPDATPTRHAAQSYHLLHWRRSGLCYWAVSDLNVTEMEQLAALICGERS